MPVTWHGTSAVWLRYGRSGMGAGQAQGQDLNRDRDVVVLHEGPPRRKLLRKMLRRGWLRTLLAGRGYRVPGFVCFTVGLFAIGGARSCL